MGKLINQWETKVAIAFLLLLTGWWICIYTLGFREQSQNYAFGATYGFMAAFGGIIGLSVSKKWGGLKSIMGTAILMLSLGLLAQEFGQLVFSFYNIFLQIEIPYPSIADIGFFGNIPFYIAGIVMLAKVSGVQLSLKNLSGKLQLIIFPLLMLIISYIFFLQGYQIDTNSPLKTFLDFGYPVGQAIYVSIAVITYSLSKKYLGGLMKNKILLLLFAFVAQYVADYNFLFQISRGTWYNAGYGDYLYLFAYFIMTLGIIQLKYAFNATQVKQ